MAMQFFAQEVPCFVAGAKPVTFVQPFQQEIINETLTIPEHDDYIPTSDTEFDTSKTYYVFEGGCGTEEDPYTYKETSDTEFQKNRTYYEKTTVAERSVQANTVYERYHDGRTVMQKTNDHGEPYLEVVIKPTPILRTVTITEADQSQTVTRTHALDFWQNRKTADYIPVCRVLESGKLGESARVFR